MAGTVPQRLSCGSGCPNESGQTEKPRREEGQPSRQPVPQPHARPGPIPAGWAGAARSPGPAPARPSAPGGGAGRAIAARALPGHRSRRREQPAEAAAGVRVPAWPRSSRRRPWTVSARPGRPRRPPRQRPPQPSHGLGRGAGPGRGSGARRGWRPRAPRPGGAGGGRERRGRGRGEEQEAPGHPPAVTHRGESSGRAGPGTAGRGMPGAPGGVGAGPGHPGPWVRQEEEEQHLLLAARENKQARQELLGPGGSRDASGAAVREPRTGCGSRHRRARGPAPVWRQLGFGSL